MQISLNIILDALESYRLEIHVPKDQQLTFSMCLPLPDDCSALHKDCIYVSGLSKAMALRNNDSDICCICLRDRISDELESSACLSGLIIINENITQTTLFTQVQTRFFTILNWVQRMQETLIRNGSMQELVDMCAPIIDNYIAVSDSSLMLLAYSQLIECDDPICVALVKHGYFPEETIQLFRKYDLFKTWEGSDTPYVDESCVVAKYPTYHKIFRFGNTYFAHAVLTCNRNPISESMIDLFSMFVDVLHVYIERTWEEKNACNHIYDTFLTDLLEGTITSKSMVEERAQYVGIPLTGQFCLFQIVTNDTANMSIGKMFIEFSDLFPRFKFIRYQQRIVAIHHFYVRDVEEQFQGICSIMEPFLQKYDALCGVSLFFQNLAEIPFCFKQSTLALKYTSHMRGSELFTNMQQRETKTSRLLFFDQKYFFCLLGENDGNAELWYHSDYHELLKKLYLYDQRHKSNNLQLLHVFLSCERNATLAATSLNMHRNNVTYHVSRIQEMLGIDLNDPYARLMLQVSFYLLELYGFYST